MKPMPVGSRVKVARNSGRHNYAIGSTITVTRIDPNDGTFMARTSGGPTGSWISWDDVVPNHKTLWEILKADLPRDMVLFLSAFEGIDSISLREDVIDEILGGLPDLNERLVAFARTEDGAAMLGLDADDGDEGDDDEGDDDLEEG
jgi:hypothetical protein